MTNEPGGNAAPDAVRAGVREAVLSLAPKPIETLNPEDRLTEDLDFDSLTLMELAVSLEERFDLRAFDETVVDLKIETVADVEALVVELAGRSEAPR